MRTPTLILQQDRSLILAVTARGAASVADGLRRFAVLEKCLDDFHYYRLVQHSLWNAAASGITTARILEFLQRASQEAVPPTISQFITETMMQYGQVWLARAGDTLLLQAASPQILAAVTTLLPPDLLSADLAARREGIPVPLALRGPIKAHLARQGWPVDDRAGYRVGGELAIAWSDTTTLRPYQADAIAAFHNQAASAGSPQSGLIVLPCGAGKTIIGVGATVALQQQTLVLCPHATAVQQWCAAYRQFTTLTDHEVREYDPRNPHPAPVTITTYQMLVARRGAGGATPHLTRLSSHDWGLIIFDEAQVLPADVFRLAADLAARRKLGLTATPVREDGREVDLAALIGPTLFDLPWSQLEAEGWIAPVRCAEVRVSLHDADTLTAAGHRAMATAPEKWPVVRRLVRQHAGEGILVIGQYLDQLRDLAAKLKAPLISGATPRAEREQLFAQFRAGTIPVLVLSRVGNVAVDLPNARVAIEVSGNYGSRQEEAQRVGRLLRPKPERADPARWYLVVADHPAERHPAARRQRFLVEQGYRYRIVRAGVNGVFSGAAG